MTIIDIPYTDIASQHNAILPEIMQAVERTISSGRFILSEVVDEFEVAFARLSQTKYAIGVNSGTDALVLAMRALDIGGGDEVITVPNSYITTASSIVLAGAKPVFVDVCDDYTLDVSLIESAITKRTKAIIPVHLTGHPCNMDAIMSVANQYGLYVIEDCAQAVSAQYKGKSVGSFGVMGCYSLHPLKTLNACGDGGVIATNDEKLCQKIRMLRNNGMANRRECEYWSSNSRLDALQAAILQVKLKYLPGWTQARRANADVYRACLSEFDSVTLPCDDQDKKSVYHTFVIQVDRRDQLKAHLAAMGIGCAIHYEVPIHLQKCAQSLGYMEGDFPVVEKQAQRILTLPVRPELEKSQLQKISKAIKLFYNL